MNDNKNTAAQPLDLSKLPRVFGVSRDAESPGGKAVLVTFHRALTDDELRTFHDGLTAKARASQPEGATGTTGAMLTDELADYELRKLHRLLGLLGVAVADTLDSDTSMACFWGLIGQIIAKLEEVQAAPASAQPDRGVAPVDVMREALLNIRDYRADVADDVAAPSMRAYAKMALENVDAPAPSPASQPVAPEATHAHNPYAAPSWDHEAMPEECDDDVAHADDWISAVIRDVAELPDRDSPPDAPDMMLVTAEELREIVARHAPAAHADYLAWHKEALTAVRGKLAAVWDGIREAVQQYSGAPCEGEPFDRLDELLSRLSNAAHAQQEAAPAVAHVMEGKWANRLEWLSDEAMAATPVGAKLYVAAVAPSDAKDATSTLKYRTCCEHPDCPTCAGYGGFYRMAAAPTTVPDHSERGAANAGAQHELTVWYGAMPESNGKSNFTAILMRNHGDKWDNMTDGITIDRSEYPDRVRYEADRVRYLIGELSERPFICDYDADKHSGYVPTPATIAAGQEAANAKDVARLDWLIQEEACVQCERLPGSGRKVFQVVWPENEDYSMTFYETPREAIDAQMSIDADNAAMAAAPSSEKGGDDHG